MRKLIRCIALCCMVLLYAATAGAQLANITRVEYYVDKDPGYGKATQLTITAAATLNNISININPASYASGVHSVGVRALNANGKWGLDNKWLFAKPYGSDSATPVVTNITRVEYYVDKDPGYGKATAVTFTAGTSLSNLAINLNPASFINGVHTLGVRARNAAGKWGLDNKWLFVKPYADDTTKNSLLPITQVEYYIDKDPGYGKATPVIVDTGSYSLSNISISINISGLTAAGHTLFVRARNAKGNWGLENKYGFKVASAVTAPSIVINRLIRRAAYCAKDTLAFSYDAAGTFNAGNVFTLQLGDSTGSFTSPVTAGTFTATGDSIVKIALPAHITDGKYRLRIVSSSPAVTGITAVDTLLIRDAPRVVVITGDSAVNIGAVNPYSVPNTTGYTWKWLATNATPVAAANTASITWAAAGLQTIKISAVSQYGCKGDTSVKMVTVYPYRIDSVAFSTITPCPGDSITVTAKVTGAYKTGNVFTVQLSDSAGNFTNPVKIGSLSATPTGNLVPVTIKAGLPYALLNGTRYRIRVTGSNPADTSAVATSAYLQVKKPALGKDSVITVCAPARLNITGIYNVTGLTTAWNTTRPDSIAATGSYRLIVTNTYGCRDTALVIVTVNPKPNLGKDTTINATGNPVDLTKAYNTTGLTATWSTATPASVGAGNYTLIVANASGCKDTAVATVKVISTVPVVSSFTPATAAPGVSVTIKGKYFTGAKAVTFGNIAAASFTVLSDSTITAVTGSGASGSVAVTTAGGTGSLPGFTICTSVSPTVTIASNAGTSICTGVKVTFTASPVNGGTAPVYKWYKNNTAVGTNSATYADSLLKNSDSVWCVLTSNAGCITTNTAKSSVLKFTVSAKVTPSVTIAASTATSICAGVKVTFTATPVNGGAAPVYRWYKNNTAVGTNSATYADSLLKNSDSVWCVLTSNAGCITTNTAKSSMLKFAVSAKVTPSVTIAANTATSICAGVKVTFTATPVNGGAAPVYQWYKNNAVVGANSATYTDSLLTNSDSVWCVLTSNAGCLIATTAKSNVLKFSINAKVAPSVTIAVSIGTNICAGTKVTFTATPLNGGTAPAYQWYKNNVVVGTNSVSYSDSLLKNGDSVWCVFTSNAGCITNNTAKSSVLNFTVSAKVSPYVTIAPSTATSICTGTKVTFTATGVNGGTAPVYKWYKNNTVVGTNSATYADSLLKNSDSVWCVLTSNAGCLVATTAKSNVLKFSVSARVTPSITIAANTATSICAGVKVTFTATSVNGGIAPVYKWYKNNTVVGTNSATYADSLLKNSDSVWCVLTSNTGCLAVTTAKSNMLKFSVNVKPALGKDTSMTVCPGKAVNIKDLYNTATGYTSVIWNTARPDSVTVAGTYSLIVTNGGGCKDTALVTVTKLTLAIPIITKTGNSAFCLSDSLVLTTSAAGSLQWYRNNSAIKLASNSRYVVKIAGVYVVKATTANGCVAASDSVVATVNQIPKPTITLLNDTLVSSALTGNQWFQGGVLIKGATGQKYSANDIDVYTVQVTSGGCKSQMSDEFVYTANTLMKKSTKASLITNKATASALVYPNPATDIAYVKLERFEGAVLVTVTDMAGKIVWQKNKLYNGTYNIPLAKLAAGTYIVTVQDRNNKRSFKLVRAK